MKVGVLGGGQLAKMLAIAAKPLNIEIVCVDPDPDCCAQQVCEVLHVAYENIHAIRRFFKSINCATIETENLPFEAISKIANEFPFYPNIESIRITQDRILEKNLLKSLSIPTVPFQRVTKGKHLFDMLTSSNNKVILKACQGGYDGKMQKVIHNLEEAKTAWNKLKNDFLIAEQFCAFDLEVSIIAVRSHSGEITYYPLTKNSHQEGILRKSIAPLTTKRLTTQAQHYAKLLLTHFDYIGVMAIEFFVVGNELLVNEIAPRVHNSGHWTIEGAQTSQFKNLLYAILDLPIGSTNANGHSTMINIISKNPNTLPSMPGVYPHIYGKQARLNRKLGHITINANDEDKMNELVTQTEFFL